MSHCKLSSEYPLYQCMPTVDINSYKIALLKYGPSHNHFKINIRKGLDQYKSLKSYQTSSKHDLFFSVYGLQAPHLHSNFSI